MLLRINSTYLDVSDDGSGEAILLLHGNRDNKDVFTEMAAALARNYRVITYDYRGHGKSLVCDDGFTYTQFIKDIRALLAKKKISKVHLIGHSLGGVLSILFSQEYPDLVKSLVLLSVSTRFNEKFRRPARGTVITEKIIMETNKAAEPYFFLDEYADVKKQIITNWSTLSPLTHQNMIRMGHVELKNYLPGLRIKTLIISGSEDKLVTVEEAGILCSKIPGAKQKVISGTGHYAFMERPEIALAYIVEFLEEDGQIDE